MTAELHALAIDDEPDITNLVAEVLRLEGWEVTEAASAEEAFKILQAKNWGAVFCDVRLGGADGFTVLRRFKEEMPATPVILMTGHASGEGALDATSFGAYDYLLKPFGIEELQALSQGIKEQILNYRPRRIRSPIARTRYQPELHLLGRSEAFIEVMKLVGRIAATDLPVLLTGESGTGKEVVASSIHSRSGRRDHPFITVNCGALSPELIESEFFGHVKGAFTGADLDRSGLLETANLGTVFVDEVTETTPAFQVKLLRALQHGEIRRVGSNQTRQVDVRIIAATNRQIEEEVAAGRFRKDLFYGLNGISVRMPSLRERREDILLLAKSFAERVYSLSPQVRFSKEVLSLLEEYSWPGNIRELENAVVRAAAVCDGTIRLKDLPERIQKYSPPQNEVPLNNTEATLIDAKEDYRLSVIEKRHVAKVLAHTKGNKQAAARLLDIDRKTLDRMIRRHKEQ